jgi:hypothetical protein
MEGSASGTAATDETGPVSLFNGSASGAVCLVKFSECPEDAEDNGACLFVGSTFLTRITATYERGALCLVKLSGKLDDNGAFCLVKEGSAFSTKATTVPRGAVCRVKLSGKPVVEDKGALCIVEAREAGNVKGAIHDNTMNIITTV